MTRRTETYDDEKWQLVPKEMTSRMRRAFYERRSADPAWAEMLAAAPKPPVVAPVAAEPVAYLHTLTYETGEGREKLSFDPENAFGVPGKDYSESYPVSIEPLYTAPLVAAPVEVVGLEPDHRLEACPRCEGSGVIDVFGIEEKWEESCPECVGTISQRGEKT